MPRYYELKNTIMPLTDESRMPFGKHKGAKMEDVPASYLLYLWEKGVHAENSALAAYIAEAFSALEKDCPDMIITHRPKR